jgi:hypothetical protein
MAVAAGRAADRERFLGWVLRRYSAIAGLSREAIRLQLGANKGAMERLELCYRPRPSRFAEDVSAVAAALGVNQAVLAQFVRRVDAVVAMSAGTSSGQHGTLMAARKRPPQTDGDGSESER